MKTLFLQGPREKEKTQITKINNGKAVVLEKFLKKYNKIML